MSSSSKTIAKDSEQSKRAAYVSLKASQLRRCKRLFMDATYGCPCLIASSAVDFFTEPPSIVVAKCSDHGLKDLRRSYQKVGMPDGRKLQKPRKTGRYTIYDRKEHRMYGRSQLISPFLRALSANDARSCWHTAYPGDPRPTVCAKSNLPSRL